jgi:hypothetical protein
LHYLKARTLFVLFAGSAVPAAWLRIVGDVIDEQLCALVLPAAQAVLPVAPNAVCGL